MGFQAAGGLMLAVIGLVVAGGGSALGAEAGHYPAFCQGIAIQGSQNRMFVSAPFSYPLKAPPETGAMRDAALGNAFAAEVKTRAGQALLDYSCYARADDAALDAFLQSTLESNKANWTIEQVEWRPPGAKAASGGPATEAAAPAPPVAASSPPGKPPASTVTADRAAEQKVKQAAELALQTERAAARAAEEARIKAAKAAEADAALRTLNGAQGQAASAALQKQEADQRAFQEQQRAYLANQQAYQEQQRAYRAVKAEHEAALKAAADARVKWQADVAACASGDRSRCAAAAESR